MQAMTSKARGHAALEGRAVDRPPVTVLYNYLYHDDHFCELTGLPRWRWHQWLNSSPEDHLAVFRGLQELAPFEMLQPHAAPSREARDRTEFVERDGQALRRDRRTGAEEPLAVESLSGYPMDVEPNQAQSVFDEADADRLVRRVPAETLLAEGFTDYVDAVVAAMGEEQFIISGGVIGTLFMSHYYVGLTNLYEMLIEKPALIEHISRRILEDNIERIRALAAAGGDAIYIDDATATSDMISVAHYERFCLPCMTQMVDEIHRLGQKAIVIYFGGVSDRLEQIVATGADGLSVEASMKGYVNDIGAIAEAAGERISVFGNVNPVTALQDGSDEQLRDGMQRQAEDGRRARGFVSCTGSPITPSTPLTRVQRFLEIGRGL